MPAYRVIADLEVEPGRAASSPTAFALRDNPEAMAEGDPLAPKLQLPFFEPIEIGDVIRFDDANVYSFAGDAWRSVANYSLVQSGGLRMSWRWRRTTGTDSVRARVLVNGSTIQNESTQSSSYTTDTVDLTGLAVGDYFQLQVNPDAGSAALDVRDIQFSVSAATKYLLLFPGFLRNNT